MTILNQKKTETMMIFRRNIVLSIIALAGFVYAEAKTVVRDSKTGETLPKASIFDNRGRFLGVASEDGVIPNIDASNYPLSVKFIGYENGEVASPSVETVSLESSSYELPEVNVSSSGRVLHLTAYARIYSTQTTSGDTITEVSEKIIDFMIPKGKVKKVKARLNPRILASRSAYHFTNAAGLDSVSDKTEQHMFSNLIRIFDQRPVPTSFNKEGTKIDSVAGKYSTKEVWRKIGDKYYVEHDGLADYKNHNYSPWELKMLGMTMTMKKAETNYVVDNLSKTVQVDDLDRFSYEADFDLKGKWFKKALKANDTVNSKTYGEVFIIDREYLSPEEAKELEKNPPVIESVEIKAPAGIPAMHPESLKLMERVHGN